MVVLQQKEYGPPEALCRVHTSCHFQALAILFAYWLYKDVKKAEYDKV